MILKVPNGENPYNVIGQYIRDHITAIEDMIVTIEIDGDVTNELFMADMEEDGYFVWKSDWWEGEKNIALIDFFPVSEAKPERENDIVQDFRTGPHTVVSDRIIINGKVYLAADKVLEIIDHEELEIDGKPDMPDMEFGYHFAYDRIRKVVEGLKEEEQE